MLALSVDNPVRIVTSNVGCQLHLESKAKVPVQHWIELLESDWVRELESWHKKARSFDLAFSIQASLYLKDAFKVALGRITASILLGVAW